jgi:hypothetical protein
MTQELQDIFSRLYTLEDSSNDSISHHLDQAPQSFLSIMNTENTTMSMFNHMNTCRYSTMAKSIVIPEIPRRCFLKWSVGSQLASGQGAVVFTVNRIDGNGQLKPIQKVARISQLRDKRDHRNFVRDVQARYLLSCKCKSIPITGLIDAFICTTTSTAFGVTISDRYDGTIIHYLLSISSHQRRRQFVEEVNTTLVAIVSKMHSCGIVHRDLHQGNVLLRQPTGSTGPVIVLTDFESAGGPYFNTSVREFSSYVYSDENAIREIIVELETICQYLNSEIVTVDTMLLEDLDISLEDMNRAKASSYSSIPELPID